ncbi:MAG: methyltransferase [Solirubrobacterales bacterium]|nr:methyltransferase [Solirubrobacterales bacterium]
MRLVTFPGVLKPPSDAAILADQLRRERLDEESSVLDLCCGSGILAIVAAQAGAGRVTALDISRRAVAATRLNAMLNGVRVRTVRGDLFAAVAGEHFSLIVSNPPYLVSESSELPRSGASRAWNAGPTGRAFLDRICAQAHQHLVPDGVLLLVHSSLCSEDMTVDALTGRGYEVRIPARHRGALGPRMRDRAPMLRSRGLLQEGEVEDIVVVRARWPGDSFASAGRRASSAREAS